MDHSRFLKLKTGVCLIALLALSACSSSKVDDAGANPPETAGDVAAAPDAKTDAVPPVGEDPSLAAQAPGALDAAGAPPPAGDPGAVADAPPPGAGDPGAAAALDAPPGDPSAVASAPSSDAPSVPVSDAPPAMNPDTSAGTAVADAPVAPIAPVSDAPVADSAPASMAVTPSNTNTSSNSDANSGGEGVHYKVKRGDTLMKIAFENYGDLYRWKEIYESNRAHISDPNHVPPGTSLTLNGAGMVTIERNGEQYLIKHGDTLGLISNNVYGTTHKWKKLWENNRQLIKDPNHIFAGFYLYYQPEARLTHDEDSSPKSGGDGSAANTPQNLPFKNQAAPAMKAAANTVAQPAAPMPGARAPASK